MLTALRDQLPRGHIEKAGIIRAIEVLRHEPLCRDSTEAESAALMNRAQQIGGEAPGMREHFERRTRHLYESISRARAEEESS